MSVGPGLRAGAVAGCSGLYTMGAAGAVALTLGKRQSWLSTVARTWAQLSLRLSGIELRGERARVQAELAALAPSNARLTSTLAEGV